MENDPQEHVADLKNTKHLGPYSTLYPIPNLAPLILKHRAPLQSAFRHHQKLSKQMKPRYLLYRCMSYPLNEDTKL